MVPDIEIVFTVREDDTPERRHRLALRKLPLFFFRDLKRATSMAVADLLEGIERADVEAYVALLWLHKRQGDKKLGYADFFRRLPAGTVVEIEDLLRDGESLLPVGADDGDADGIDEEGDDEDPPGFVSSSPTPSHG